MSGFRFGPINTASFKVQDSKLVNSNITQKIMAVI